MGKAFLFLIIISTSGATFLRPWIGSLAYYMLAIFGPQYIWWWNFEGLRVSFFIAVSTIGAFCISTMRGVLNFNLLFTKLNLAVIILWTALAISYFTGPYIDLTMLNPQHGSPLAFLYQANKIFLFYLISTLLIDDLKKANVFSWIMIAATIYLIYWANYQYLSQNWFAFEYGRLKGPGGLTGNSPYHDENTFAMLFVTGLPFLFYYGLYQLKGLKRILLWLIIPLGWHAIFLTVSRGGLVGIGATLFLGMMFSNHKKIAILLIPVFLIAFQWQSGDLLKDRSHTIVDYEGESSAETRIEAWAAALNMLQNNPVTGVGIGSFITAMPHFSDKQPRATHSTPFQFAAEAGYPALLAYCYIIWAFFRGSYKIRKRLLNHRDKFPDKDWSILMYLNEATLVSFFGLFVCALFLSLNYYEIFFYLLILFGFSKYYVFEKLNQAFNKGAEVHG